MPADPHARPIFVCEIEQFGGAERALLALSRWLAQRGLAHYLLTYRDHCNIAQYAAHPLEVVDLKAWHGARAKVSALKNHMAFRPKSAPPLLCSGYQAALHATLAGVCGFHDLMHDTPSLFGDKDTRGLKGKLRIAASNLIAGFGLRSGGTTIVTSEFLKAECRRDFGVEAQIVRMGGLTAAAETSRSQPRNCMEESAFHMLSISRIEANKRIDWLLRALNRLESGPVAPLAGPLSRLIDWKLDIAGKGSLLSELEALTRSLGLADRVSFHGFVPDRELEALSRRSDLFLMPAVQGYGIPAIEAIDRGTPVLLHRDSGVSDILLQTPWATVFEGGEQQLAAALAQAIDSARKGRHLNTPPPQLPTEDQWAEQVAVLCHWT